MSRLELAVQEQKINSEESRDRQERKLDDLYRILLDHIAKNDKR